MKYPIVFITVLALQLLFAKTQMVELTIQNFKDHLKCEYSQIQSHSTQLQFDWFIMFMAPWCGHCKAAKPQFQKFSSYIQDGSIIQLEDQNSQKFTTIHLKAAIVNCIDNRLLCGTFGIKGFPTFVYITKDRKGIKYTGPRTTESFLNFTLFHDPQQNHKHAQSIQLVHTIWDDIKDGVKQYWWQIIVFGVAIPSAIGYGLGQLIYGRPAKKAQQAPLLNLNKETKEEGSQEKDKKQE